MTHIHTYTFSRVDQIIQNHLTHRDNLILANPLNTSFFFGSKKCHLVSFIQLITDKLAIHEYHANIRRNLNFKYISNKYRILHYKSTHREFFPSFHTIHSKYAKTRTQFRQTNFFCKRLKYGYNKHTEYPGVTLCYNFSFAFVWNLLLLWNFPFERRNNFSLHGNYTRANFCW